MSIGSRIKEARTKKEMTQEELANKINVTKGAIANYENGVSTPKLEILIKLLHELDCDANYIYQDEIQINQNRLLHSEDAALLQKYKQLDPSRQQIIDFLMDLLLEQQNKTIK